jgi:hypothetical protein
VACTYGYEIQNARIETIVAGKLYEKEHVFDERDVRNRNLNMLIENKGPFRPADSKLLRQ